MAYSSRDSCVNSGIRPCVLSNKSRLHIRPILYELSEADEAEGLLEIVVLNVIRYMSNRISRISLPYSFTSGSGARWVNISSATRMSVVGSCAVCC